MTEQEWLACDNLRSMLALFGARGTGRKTRLFACACCRRCWALAPQDARDVVELAERYADKRHTGDQFSRHQLETALAIQNGINVGTASPADCVRIAAANALRKGTASLAAEWIVTAVGNTLGIGFAVDRLAQQSEGPAQVALLRDIFGNPFRPVAFDPDWRTSTAVALAKQMYDSRDFSAMPILADALQDAGCASDDVLTHCRAAAGVHVRGCWVVDLVLGKS